MSRFSKKPETAAAKKAEFLRLGDIQVPFDGEYADDKTPLDPSEAAELKELGHSVCLNFYFSDYIKKKHPELFKADSIALQTNDRILVRFEKKPKAKDFVIGGAYIKGVDGSYIEIGNLTLTKKSDTSAPGLREDLKASNTSLTYKVYLPKDMQAYNVESGEKFIMHFKAFDKDPKFVLGHVSVAVK